MSETSPRLGLPLLAAGQAQKEVYHNEALVLLDALTQPVVQQVGLDTPPATPAAGQCWIVGTTPTGEWSGHGGAVALWSDGGWRFVAPFDGLCLWDASTGLAVRRTGGSWASGVTTASRVVIGGKPVVGAREPAIAGPAGGTIVDVEARGTIAAILAALRNHGLIG